MKKKMIRNCQINNIDLNDLTPNYYVNISDGSIPNDDESTQYNKSSDNTYRSSSNEGNGAYSLY